MTPAGTSNELDVQNKWEENARTHNTHTTDTVCMYSGMVASSGLLLLGEQKVVRTHGIPPEFRGGVHLYI